MRNSIKLIGILTAALSMMLTATVISTPDAEAHAVGGTFTHSSRAFGTTCESGYTQDGPTVNEFDERPVIACRPNGYSPVGTDAELCSEAPGARQVEGICTYDSSITCGTRSGFNYRTPSGLCVRPVLILDSELAAHRNEKVQVQGVSLICIEAERVQENAQGMKLGDRFFDDYVEWEIVTGGTFCSFNCFDGYDINCDGKLGDFCPVEYDLSKVTDVGMCLEGTSATS